MENLNMSDLPVRPAPGQKRYKAYSRKPGDNPFHPRGLREYTQTVDIAEDITREQVEQWARQSAKERGYQFLRLEVIV